VQKGRSLGKWNSGKWSGKKNGNPKANFVLQGGLEGRDSLSITRPKMTEDTSYDPSFTKGGRGPPEVGARFTLHGGEEPVEKRGPNRKVKRGRNGASKKERGLGTKWKEKQMQCE